LLPRTLIWSTWTRGSQNMPLPRVNSFIYLFIELALVNGADFLLFVAWSWYHRDFGHVRPGPIEELFVPFTVPFYVVVLWVCYKYFHIKSNLGSLIVFGTWFEVFLKVYFIKKYIKIIFFLFLKNYLWYQRIKTI